VGCMLGVVVGEVELRHKLAEEPHMLEPGVRRMFLG
jgi:hypothetical protein